MELFVSIISALLITTGIILLVFRKKFVLLDGMGEQLGTALGVVFITGGLSVYLIYLAVTNG